jgi:hypothetical protein
LEEIGFEPYTYMNLTAMQLERLFFAYLESVNIYKMHLEVVLLDCTYKTNCFCMLLLMLDTHEHVFIIQGTMGLFK